MTLNPFDLLLWLIPASLIAYTHWWRPKAGVGLTLAYTATFSLSHWPAALLYVLPWYGTGLSQRAYLTALGFRESLYGMAALAFGAIILGPFLYNLIEAGSQQAAETPSLMARPRLSRLFILSGLASYLLLTPLLGGIPTLSAIISVASDLLVVGLGLACWQAWQAGQWRAFFSWLVLAGVLPFFTLITRGFLGYGVTSLIIVLMFVASFGRWRWRLIPVLLLLGYLGLSLYVTYMRDRAYLRAVIWGGQSWSERAEALGSTFGNYELFDWRDPAHLYPIDGRLNQNYLVGAADEYLANSYKAYAYGETLWQAAIAPIPRALWPNKPVAAGSMGLVSQYTGISFAEGTSVGLGQVLEFYINFGTAGVIGGFLLLGAILAAVDAAAAHYLYGGDWARFLLWYLPGLGLLQTGGSLVEVTATVAAGVITALLVTRYLVPFFLGSRQSGVRARLAAKPVQPAKPGRPAD